MIDTRFIRYAAVLVAIFGLGACDQPSADASATAQPTIAAPAENTVEPTTIMVAAETTEPSEPEVGAPLPTISSASGPDSQYQELSWDSLMPEDYRPEKVLARFMEQLAGMEDDDPRAMEVYGQIQAELENAPVNQKLNRLKVKLPGFIAPLENTDGKVSEFLLVPYYGACIHVPPPPVNQTVLIKTLPESAIKVDNIYDPIWVKGEILTEGKKTDIGNAGYRIVDARVEPYE